MNDRNSKESFQLNEMPRIRSGIFISKSLAILIMVFFLTIFLTIGLLVGLLGRRTNTEKIYYVNEERTSTIQPTISITNPSQSTTTTTTDPFGNGPWQNIRLPEEIEPVSYNLQFYDINYENGTYRGTTIMNFKLKNGLKYILFHIKFLKIESFKLIHVVDDENENEVTVLNHFEYVKNQYYVLESNSEFESGMYHLSVIFTGSTKIGIVGMYQSSYVDYGETKTMIATKFEPTDARKAFPCFDEPALKATYDVTIQHPSGTYALSNFPVKSNSTNGDIITTSFNTTFKMSTYLVAWAIVPNDFGYEEDFTEKDKLPIRVYGRKYAYDNGLLLHALDIAKKSIDYYENIYFNISEALPPKIDLIAIPDFPSGAMENWGLIGFRETSLLYSNKTSSTSSKQSIALTVSHELAHFWFGNLVTCKWWNDLWLNEAMASFLEYKAINYIHPEWTMEEQVIMLDIVPVLWDDAFPTSHPVEANVVTPDQINNVFDSITYAKGQGVLRQLESVVGEEEFQLGLRNYLTINRFSSGVAADFYNSLALPNDMKDKTTPVKYMETWLLQMNYPLVDVKLERNEAQNSSKIKFTQERFLMTPLLEDAPNPQYVSPFNYVWQIYLRCTAGGTYNATGDGVQHTIGNTTTFTLFMDQKTAEYTQNGRLFTWVKCNPDFRSFYTTNYDEGVYEAFEYVLSTNHEAFSIGDRANLIHVSYQLAFRGTLSYSVPATLSSYLSLREKDYIPWRVFIYHSTLLIRLLEHRASFLKFSNYAKSVVESLTDTLDLYQESDKPKDHLTSLLESFCLEFLCRLQDELCLKNASDLFNKIPQQYFMNPNNIENPLPSTLRSTAYRYHLQNTYNVQDWFDVFGLYRLSGDPQEKNNALIGLSFSRSTWILVSYLDELLKPESDIRKQDFFSVLNAVARNPSGRHLAWYFYRHNWDKIVNKFGLGDRTFGRSIKAISESFSNEFLLAEMYEFFANHLEAGAGEEPRKQAIEAVQTNIYWIKNRENDLNDAFSGPGLIF